MKLPKWLEEINGLINDLIEYEQSATFDKSTLKRWVNDLSRGRFICPCTDILGADAGDEDCCLEAWYNEYEKRWNPIDCELCSRSDVYTEIKQIAEMNDTRSFFVARYLADRLEKELI